LTERTFDEPRLALVRSSDLDLELATASDDRA
jgi:hypothetical protein